jgi:hypothetical protein
LGTEERLIAEEEWDQLTAKDSPNTSGDAVVLPSHYTQWPIEPITFIMTNEIPFAEGNVIKYIMRHPFKNGEEDVRKAMRYCEMILEGCYGQKPRESKA